MTQRDLFAEDLSELESRMREAWLRKVPVCLRSSPTAVPPRFLCRRRLQSSGQIALECVVTPCGVRWKDLDGYSHLLHLDGKYRPKNFYHLFCLFFGALVGIDRDTNLFKSLLNP